MILINGGKEVLVL